MLITKNLFHNVVRGRLVNAFSFLSWVYESYTSLTYLIEVRISCDTQPQPIFTTLDKKQKICYHIDMKQIKQSNKELPNSIKIGYVNYQFDFWPDSFASTEEAQGEFFQLAGKIGLKESTIPSVHGVNTLLHEILHGIVYQYGLVETLGDREEQTVNTISNGLTAVLVDNPWLVDYMKKYI